MVCVSLAIEKVVVTGVAAAYCALPVCVAWMEHVPFANADTGEHTVGVREVNVTGKLEEDVAVKAMELPIERPAVLPETVMT